MPCTSPQLRCRLANAYNAATNWRVPQKTTPHSALLTPNYKIIRSFDALSIAAPRPQQNRHVMSASRSHKAAFFRKKIAPPSQRSPPKPRHKANFSTGHQTSCLALKTRNFFRQRTPSEQIDPPSLQQRAAATAYANTENHPSSKHIKIDTTKRSPRTLHSKANA